MRLLKAGLLLCCLAWPMLAIADIAVETGTLRLQFTDSGDLLRAEACYPACADAHAKTRVLSHRQGMLVLKQGGGQALQAVRERDGDATLLSFTDASGRLRHRWRIPDQGWLLSLESTAGRAVLASGEDFRPRPSAGFGNWLEQARYLVFDGGDVSVGGLDEEEPLSALSNGWFGFRNRFWAAMVLPDNPLTFSAETGAGVLDAHVEMVQEGGPGLGLLLYLGPVEPRALSGAAAELEGMMYSALWFWLRWICQGMYWLLGAIALAVPNWGLAVMLLSLTVGILMRPLSRVADRLQGQVHEIDARLSPLLADIKKDYKGAEQSEKIIEMYKAEGVHPLYSLKSLAGVAVVIPVFIGAFDMLAENIHLSGVSFLWIADMSQPDRFWPMPFELPFFGAWLNLLPFVMTGLSFIASKLHAHPAMDIAARRRQARNLILMSLGFLVLFYTFPAGMVLYWTTNNLISVIKTLWKRKALAAG